jgi:hypothetical protein
MFIESVLRSADADGDNDDIYISVAFRTLLAMIFVCFL